MGQNIDIIVPTYNRPDDLKKFLHEIHKQDYPSFTVWIIDDNGCLPIKELIPENKNYIYIRQPETNKGPAYKRNIVIESGKGEIIISMDDDAWFDNDNFALKKVTTYFNNYPEMGCLMFNIATPLTNYDDNKLDGSELPLHITCGCAYRRSVLENIGGFNGFFHSMAEEVDLSLKIISAGYKILFARDIKVYHNFNPQVRSKKWYRTTRYKTVRNDLLVVSMRYPLKMVPVFLFGKYINHILYDVRNKKTLVAVYLLFSVIFGFFFMLPKALRFRKPMSLEKFKYWRGLF